MSSRTILSGIQANLSSASVCGNNVGYDYRILEKSSACCVVLGLSIGSLHSVTFGGSGENTWTFSLEGFVKEQSDASQVLFDVTGFIDLVTESLRSDLSIQETGTLQEIRILRTPGEWLSIGSRTWHPITFNVDVHEFS